MFQIFASSSIPASCGSWPGNCGGEQATTLKKALLPFGLLMVWLIPIFLPPGNVYRGALPEKPRLIAHRGASTLAPENTRASARMAADLGVHGLETDITVSADGVLFLMHDDILARTTDAAQVFPGREDDQAETFTWDELSHLDAGSWFKGRTAFPGEPIPTLEAVLQGSSKTISISSMICASPPDILMPVRLSTCAWKKSRRPASPTTPGSWRNRRRALRFNRLSLSDPGGRDRLPPKPTLPASLIAAGYRVVNSVYGLSNRVDPALIGMPVCGSTCGVDEPWQYSRHGWQAPTRSPRTIPRACWPSASGPGQCPTASTCRYGRSGDDRSSGDWRAARK